MSARLRVSSPPAKPVILYDGECGFCFRCVQKGRLWVGDRVEFEAFQDRRRAQQFPELPISECQRAVQFIDTDGWVYSGAEATARALARNPSRAWLFRAYSQSRWLAAAAEWAYRFVARHRSFFSRLTA